MKKKYLIIPLVALMTVTGCTKYNGLPQEEAEHEHTYTDVYSSDANEHWLASTCGHDDQRRAVEGHKFNEYITSQEATVTEKGIKVRTCSVCGYKDEVELPKIGEENTDNPDNPNPDSWKIEGINLDRETITMTVGDPAISVIPTLVGEGKFPTSLAVSCPDMDVKEMDDGVEVTKNVKVAQISSGVVESGTAFSVSAIAAGTIKITVASTAKPEIKKEIVVTVNAKVEHHEITLGNSEVTMKKGSKRVLECTSTDKVTWTSSDPSVVALENITNSGLWLKALKSSSEPVTVTATICGGTSAEYVKTCLVTVEASASVNYYYINNQKLNNISVFKWNSDKTNAQWPGEPIGEKDYINKDLNDVYEIEISEEDAWENIIVSGYDSEGKFVQTNDISISSFIVQNAFTIPSLPDMVDGTRKASVKLCTFDSNKDVADDNYINFSMYSADMFVGNTLDVIVYTTASEINVEVVNGSDNVQISNVSKNGFKVTALNAGTAEISANINVDGNTISVAKTLTVNIVADEKLTFYFTNNYKWSNLKVFYWNDETGKNNGAFPGVDLDDVFYQDQNKNDVYEISFNKLADNWKYFIISGNDSSKEGRVQTADISIAQFGTSNGVQISGWQKNSEDKDTNVANVEYGSFSNKLYIKYSGNLNVLNGTSEYISVNTNGENLVYQIMNGDDKIQLSEQSDSGVKVTGLQTGSAQVKISCTSGSKSATTAFTVYVVDEVVSTYYFYDSDNLKNVKAYFYIDETRNNSWPGEDMELVDSTLNGNKVYKIDFMKYQKNWEYMIVSGEDASGRRIQTVNIELAKLGSENMVQFSGWSDQDKGIKAITTKTFGDYVSVEKNSVSIRVGDPYSVKYKASQSITIQNNNTSAVEASEENGNIKIRGLAVGTAILTIKCGSEKETITVTVRDTTQNLVTYYFANNYCWSNLKVFMWGPEGTNADFPGVEISSLPIENQYGNDTYAIAFDRNYKDYTGMIISGTDGEKGWAKTADIIFADLDSANKNMISINETEWATKDYPSENQSIYKCSFANDTYAAPADKLNISCTELKLGLNQIGSITLDTNVEFMVSLDNPNTVQINIDGKVVKVKPIGTGTVHLGFFKKGTDNELLKTCTVTVTETAENYKIVDYPSWYLNDNAKLYVWAWGGSAGLGKWYEVQQVGNELVIQSGTETNFDGCKLVRFNPNVFVEPTFDEGGKELIWNQSEKLTFINGIATYDGDR